MKPITLFAALICAGLFVSARSYGFVELYAFPTPGPLPSSLIQASNGNFYGTTQSGGAAGNGTVFSIAPTGAFTTLVTFSGSNGITPISAPVQGSDGNFYGTTYQGGAANYGTVYKMTPAGELTTLASFYGTNGCFPEASLAQGSDGNFYGTASSGGWNGDGTIFKVTPTGELTTLAYFHGTNGMSPVAALAQGGDGNFYGTTPHYSNPLEPTGPGNGTVFKMTPDGTLTTLYLFTGLSSPGAYAGTLPLTALLPGNDGNFYGTTLQAVGAWGTVFEITPAGVVTTLVGFTPATGDQPRGALIQGAEGNFYGTTSADGPGGSGTVFRMSPAGVLTTLVAFNGTNGADPQAALVQGSDGNFYGTTQSGGSLGGGNIFRIDSLQTPPPIATAMAGNQIVVSWPENYPIFTLQMATNLNPPMTWLDATDSPVNINAQFTITNSLSNGKFYRLRR